MLTSRVPLHFIGSDPAVALIPGAPLPGMVNYLSGSDPRRWHTRIPTYGGLTYRGLYPGIDLAYGGHGGDLKGSYTIAPGANPGRIRWNYPGAAGVSVDTAGNLQVTFAAAAATPYRPAGRPVTVTERAPSSWQEIGGARRPVPTRYQPDPGGGIHFVVGDYDHAQPLVIDPELSYSTYVGGTPTGISSDTGNGIAVDTGGDAYMVGDELDDTSYPTTTGAFQQSWNDNSGVVVTKLNPTGSALVYSTYLVSNTAGEEGGSSGAGASNLRGTHGKGIALDCHDGPCSAVVAGYTNDPGFPTTPSAFQPTRPPASGKGSHGASAFVSKLAPDGSTLAYSTFLTSTDAFQDDAARAVAVHDGRIVVTGHTSSPGFPTTAGAYEQSHPWATQANEVPQAAFVAAFDPGRSGMHSLLYSTFLGGNDTGMASGQGIAVDAGGDAFVAGYITCPCSFPTTSSAVPPPPGRPYDTGVLGFVSELDAGGGHLLYSTYLGGSGSDEALAVSVDARGHAYVAGNAQSGDFPTTAGAYSGTLDGAQDAFVVEVDPARSGRDGLLYSTYVGGGGTDGATAVAVDAASSCSAPGGGATTAPSIHLSGVTSSADFPVQQSSLPYGGGTDAFALQLTPAGRGAADLDYSMYLGGSGNDNGNGVAVDSSGATYVTGHTSSSNFPTTAGSYQSSTGPAGSLTAEAFITKVAADRPAASPSSSSFCPSGTPSPTPGQSSSPTPSSTPTPAPSVSPGPTPTPGSTDSPWVDAHTTPMVPLPPQADNGSASAYDSTTQRLVLYQWTPPQNDPTVVRPQCLPPAYCGPTVDPAPAGGTWTWDGTSWTKQAPASSPTPSRAGASMAFDPASRKIVLFGGWSTTYNQPHVDSFYNDTWIWDGASATWTREHPEVSPPARQQGVMAPDARGRLVLFGGEGADGNSLGDTWTWDGTVSPPTWRQEHPAASPPPRTGAAMAYDEARKRDVMIGGDWFATPPPPNYTCCDPATWTWDGVDWHKERSTLDATNLGGHVWGAVAAYQGDPTNPDVPRQVVLNWRYGTWTWNGAQWTQRNPQVSPPIPRFVPTLAYYPPKQNLVLTVGADDTRPYGTGDAVDLAGLNSPVGRVGTKDDTWTWDGRELPGGLSASYPSTLYLDPDAIPADGASTSTATVAVEPGGHGVSGLRMRFSTTGTVTFGPVTDHGDGTYSTTITASRTVDTEVISASVEGGPYASGAFNAEAHLTQYAAPAAVHDCNAPPSNAPPAWTDLDRSFGCAGSTTTSLSPDMRGGPMAVQNDGMIVASGISHLMRYSASGRLDPSFGDHGDVAVSPVDHAMAVQPDGSVLLADRPIGAGAAPVQRYDRRGRPDPSFTVGWDKRTALHGLLVQPDGKILLLGYGNGVAAAGVGTGDLTNLYINRYNSDGSPDAAGFGQNGTAVVTLPGIVIATGLALQPDGRILFSGEMATSTDTGDMVVGRLNPDGTRDSSFNRCSAPAATACGGVVLSDFTTASRGSIAAAMDVLPQPDGRIVAVGAVASGNPVTYTTPGGRWGFALVRYNADGTPDAGFNPCSLGAVPCGGQEITDHFQGWQDRSGSGDQVPPDSGQAWDAALQPDGRIVVAGWGGPTPKSDMIVARYNPDGILDACGSVGYTRVRPWDSDGSGQLSRAAKAWSVAVQHDGRILLGGATVDADPPNADGFGVARLMGGGPPPQDAEGTTAGVVLHNGGGGELNGVGQGCPPESPVYAGPVAAIGDAEDVTKPPVGAETAQATFTVTLSKPSDQDVTLYYSTGPGDPPSAAADVDYAAMSNQRLVIPRGRSFGVIPVTIRGGPGGSPPRRNYTVSLVGAPQGAIYGRALGKGSIVVPGTGGATPTLTVSDPSVCEPDRGAVPAYFSVVVGGLPEKGRPVLVNYETRAVPPATEGHDYMATRGTLTFTREEMQRSQRRDQDVIVPVLANHVTQGEREFEVVLTGASGARIVTGTAAGRILEECDAIPGTPGEPPLAAVVGVAGGLVTHQTSGSSTPPVEAVSQAQLQPTAGPQVQAQEQLQAQTQAQAQAAVQAGLMLERERELQLERARLGPLASARGDDGPVWAPALVWAMALGLFGYALRRGGQRPGLQGARPRAPRVGWPRHRARRFH